MGLCAKKSFKLNILWDISKHTTDYVFEVCVRDKSKDP